MTGDDFGWLSTSALGDAACVTMVRTTDTGGVLRGFGGLADEARTLSLDQLWDEFEDAGTVAVCRRGEHVVAIEVNGFQGSRPEVLREVSALGETVSAFWNVDAMTLFSYAVGGRVKTSFEAGIDSWRDGDDPGCLADSIDAIDWAPGDWKTGMLRLAAEVTGRPFAEDWLDGEFLVVPIAPRPEDVHPVTPGFERLEYDHPVLGSALHRAEDEALLAVAGAAVDEMDGYLSGATRAQPVALEAVRALRAAPNPLTAAFKTIEAAELAKQIEGADPAPMLASFLDVLGNPPAPSGSDGARVSGTSPLERHAWITGHWLGLGASVTYARGMPFDTVAAAFGGVPLGRGPVSLTDTEQVALRENGGWVLAIGFNRSPFAHEVVDALRPHGAVLNVGWETRGNKLVHYAEPGHEVAMIRPGQTSEPLRSFTDALPEPSPGGVAAWLLALGEVVTGIAMTPESLDAEHTLLSTGRKK
ncbi:DUF6461 domain-containing protein [Amycolatopsis minnesotensis]|uniref:Uncharacterized protein n=1 Tax=Amycolatopsis minnesotensis TaxID=337894 RepID=A0ABN2SQL0_9PSEU